MKKMLACGARIGGKTTVSYQDGDTKITITTEKAANPAPAQTEERHEGPGPSPCPPKRRVPQTGNTAQRTTG